MSELSRGDDRVNEFVSTRDNARAVEIYNHIKNAVEETSNEQDARYWIDIPKVKGLDWMLGSSALVLYSQSSDNYFNTLNDNSSCGVLISGFGEGQVLIGQYMKIAIDNATNKLDLSTSYVQYFRKRSFPESDDIKPFDNLTHRNDTGDEEQFMYWQSQFTGGNLFKYSTVPLMLPNDLDTIESITDNYKAW